MSAQTATDRGSMVATAMSHPTRVQILMAMNTPPQRMSPKMFASHAGLEVPHCAYHFKELVAAGCIELVETRQRRGATEHIYEPLEAALAWTSEWERLRPQVKRSVLTSVMGGGVQALGSAIDSGTFEARDDSHMSWNTVELDVEGWSEVSILLDQTLKKVLRIERKSGDRIAAGADCFLASYFLASFESPLRHDALQDPNRDLAPIPPARQRPTRDKRRARRRAARSKQDEQQVMAKVMSHETRVRILMSMNTPRRRLSPKVFAEETGLPVHHCAYHFAELEDTGCIALVATRQRRGATEHIYEPRKAALQWTDDWKLLGPAIKQSVLASVMRGAVEALGEAIESGTFEARAESHMSWSTIKVDEQGWAEIAEVFDRALEGLIAIDMTATKRIARGNPFFAASYFMASFESPPDVKPLSA